MQYHLENLNIELSLIRQCKMLVRVIKASLLPL